MNKDKQLLVLISIMVALVSFLGGYLLTQPQISFHPNEGRASLLNRFSQDQTPIPELPKGPFNISPTSILAPINAPNGNAVRYYEAATGKVFDFDLSRRTRSTISETLLPHLVNAIWAPNKKQVITVYSNTKGPQYSYFNYETHKTIPLGTLSAVTFSPDSKSIAYISSGTVMVGVPGAATKQIIQLRFTDIVLYWPTTDSLAIKAYNEGTDGYDLYLLGLNGDLSKVDSEGSPFSVSFSPNGELALISYDQKLKIINLSGLQPKNISLSTDTEHCTWSLNSSNIFCAAAKEGETSIYNVDVVTGLSKEVVGHIIGNPSKPFLSELEDYIIYQDTSDSRLYGLKIN